MGTYTDCSQGVCSMYCPRFCYIIFPPPPPSGHGRDGGGGGDPSGLEFSPLIVAVIGILVSAFILVCYYTIISKYCRRRGGISHTSLELNENHHDLMSTDRSLQASSASGLDEALIKSITVWKYKKGDGLVEGTDCSVCLSEFEENESLRLLPKCNHAFHLPCIDAWLKSHSSCPLCRSNINASTNSSLPHQTQPTQETPPPPPTINVSALEHHHRGNDTILVVQDLEEHPVVSSLVSDHGMIPKASVSEIRRSVSLNYSFCHGRVLSVADILRATEDDDEHQREHQVSDLVDSPGMNRSISTGRFMFTRYGSSKGNNSIIPN